MWTPLLAERLNLSMGAEPLPVSASHFSLTVIGPDTVTGSHLNQLDAKGLWLGTLA